MKIGLFVNSLRDCDYAITKKIIEQVKKYDNLEYRISLAIDDVLAPFESVISLKELCKFSDIVITIGGDGTTLSVIALASKFKTSVLGINAGNMGFLTQISSEDEAIENIIARLVNGDFETDERFLIKATVGNKDIYALNEIMICRDAKIRVANISVYIDGILADQFRADGALVASPTGSTAYSLSCNGPVLSPDVDAFVINAICPHIMHGRPIVVNAKSVVELKGEIDLGELNVAGDGYIYKTKQSHISVSIKKSDKTVKFIKLENKNFYNTLLQKLNYLR